MAGKAHAKCLHRHRHQAQAGKQACDVIVCVRWDPLRKKGAHALVRALLGALTAVMLLLLVFGCLWPAGADAAGGGHHRQGHGALQGARGSGGGAEGQRLSRPSPATRQPHFPSCRRASGRAVIHPVAVVAAAAAPCRHAFPPAACNACINVLSCDGRRVAGGRSIASLCLCLWVLLRHARRVSHQSACIV